MRLEKVLHGCPVCDTRPDVYRLVIDGNVAWRIMCHACGLSTRAHVERTSCIAIGHERISRATDDAVAKAVEEWNSMDECSSAGYASTDFMDLTKVLYIHECAIRNKVNTVCNDLREVINNDCTDS